MKLFVIFLIGFLPIGATAQKVILLSVNQPPEFGFSISRSDTTILKTTSVVLGTDLVVYGGSGEYQFLWSPSETLSDPTILNPVATPLDTTTYILIVTDKNGCSIALNYTVNTRGPLVGNNIVYGHQGLEAILFPNPNDGKFKVQIKGPIKTEIEFAIYDINGRNLYRQTVLDFPGECTEDFQLKLENGIYNLIINAGSEILSRQFIIR